MAATTSLWPRGASLPANRTMGLRSTWRASLRVANTSTCGTASRARRARSDLSRTLPAACPDILLPACLGVGWSRQQCRRGGVLITLSSRRVVLHEKVAGVTGGRWDGIRLERRPTVVSLSSVGACLRRRQRAGFELASVRLAVAAHRARGVPIDRW